MNDEEFARLQDKLAELKRVIERAKLRSFCFGAVAGALGTWLGEQIR